MVQFIDEAARSQEEKKILTALAFMGEVIAGKCQIKLEESQDLDFLTEKSARGAQETNKIR